MADLVEGLVCHVAQTVFGSLTIEHKDDAGQVTRRINLTRPWRRARMTELVEELLGWRFDKQALADQPEVVRRRIYTRLAGRTGHGTQTPEHEADRLATLSSAEQLVEVYEKLIEPTLIDPCFVTHVPSVTIPLAKENRDDPFFADVYELAVNGVELSPGYSELNDPDVQARHFAHQVGDEAEKQKTDDDFLAALKYGMPPAGGMGLGVDRLLMMLSGAQSIRDVILFPLMKPHAAATAPVEKT
jgi:lysyl-tRNA synthetase class 2